MRWARCDAPPVAALRYRAAARHRAPCWPIAVLLLLTALPGPVCGAAAAPGAPPNVLLILADDMGFSDLHVNHPAADAPTPRLDRLAAEGVRFTRHYAESSCSPARAALLTGRSPVRTGFKPNGLGIPAELTTLPELFKAAGYRTHQIGKWHLGHLLPEAWPDRQGFDTWLGYLNQWVTGNNDRAQGFRYTPPTHIDAFLQDERGDIRRYPGHLTDVLTRRAAEIIRTGAGAPWFVYLAYSAPHTPIQPHPDYAARFPDDPAGRYRAMLAQLDDRVGELLDLLDATGQRDRTIVVFVSDNGGTNNELDNNAPFAGKKAEYREGGLRTPLLVRWPGQLAGGQVVTAPVSIVDIYPTLARMARLPLPGGLDGTTLFEQGRPAAVQPRSLYWASDAGRYRSFGALSPDGRWRLQRDPFNGMMLYDLATDPAGVQRLPLDADPAGAELLAAFHRWYGHATEPDLAFRPIADNGRGLLTGDPLQRSIVAGDFTLGLGITPHRIARERQTLLEQSPALAVTASADRLHIRLHEFEFDVPPPPPGRCTSLVVTGTLVRPVSRLPAADSEIEVYLDGRRVADARRATPAPPRLSTAPTFVGQNAEGTELFAGRLSRPALLTRRTFTDSSPEQTLAALNRRLCGGHP